MSIPFRVTPTSITLVLNGVTHILTQESHPNYDKVREALKAKEFDQLEALIDVPKAVEAFGKGKVKVVDGVVYYGDYAIHNTLTKRMMEMMGEGFDVDPMALFLENLMQNPSKRAVDELYDFLEACDLPITDDGHFVAYKKVRSDYRDIYTGKMDNSVGQILTMPRNMVDEDKARTCSAGLHFCSQSYLPHFGASHGDKVVIVKINPADVVAIPADYHNAKGRTCRYEVIGEVDPSELKFYNKSVYETNPEDADGMFDDEEEFEDIMSSSEEYSSSSSSSSEDVMYEVYLDDRFDDEFETLYDAMKHAESIKDGGLKTQVIESVNGAEVWVHHNPTFGKPKEEAQPVAQSRSALNPTTAWPFPVNPAPVAQPKQDGVLFTKAQAAAILGISLVKLEEYLAAGKGVELVGDLVRIKV